MSDKEFNYEKHTKGLDEADLFLRGRAQAAPTPLNTFDIAMMFCIAKACRVSINLINCQKAEIEKLRKRISEQKHTLFEQQAYAAKLQNEIERLEKARQKQAQFLAEQKAQKYELIDKLSRAKTEAYKEFAKRLKELTRRFHYLGFSLDYALAVETSEIDNLLKEMIGNVSDNPSCSKTEEKFRTRRNKKWNLK